MASLLFLAVEEAGCTEYVRGVLDGDEGKSDGRTSIQPRASSKAGKFNQRSAWKASSIDMG